MQVEQPTFTWIHQPFPAGKKRWWARRMREMKCDNEAVWIELLAQQHQKKEVTSEMTYIKVENERECVLCVECWKYRKKIEAWASLGVQFVGHMSCLWWDGVCDICKFRPARTGIKWVISALLLHLLLHSGTEPTSVLTRQGRQTGQVTSSQKDSCWLGARCWKL